RETPRRPRTRRPRLRRRVGLAVALALVVVVAWLAWLLVDALRARAALEDVAARLPVLQEQVRSGQDATATVHDVRGSAPRAAAVEVASPAALAPSGGSLDLAPLADARDDVVAADRAVTASLESVAGIDTASLVGPLAAAVDDLRDELAQVASQTSTAARAVDLVPAMLGADGARDYLVLVQNNAEPRATGGIAGSVLHLRADAGDVALVEVRPGSALGPLPESIVDLSGAEAALFGDD